MTPERLLLIVEAALLAAGQPLSLERLLTLFDEREGVSRDTLRKALAELALRCEGGALELREVGSGWRLQVRGELTPWLARLWQERPQRYSRAVLETLAIIAWRQPVTRGEIEDIRGVSVGTPIIRGLEEREWIRVIGHRDVPGRPALFGTTRHFLDHFNLKSLDELPSLAELRDIERINEELDLQ